MLKQIFSFLKSPGPQTLGVDRVTGPPTSSNGASSFHLKWQLPQQSYKEVRATIKVKDMPGVDKLYFWALQADLFKGNFRKGGTHFGIQFHPQYPNKTAVNWGGYDDKGDILPGSESKLGSSLNNANTCDYVWKPNTEYLYRIYKGAKPGWWTGSITDTSTGIETVVRDLFTDADSISSPIVWTECLLIAITHRSLSIGQTSRLSLSTIKQLHQNQ